MKLDQISKEDFEKGSEEQGRGKTSKLGNLQVQNINPLEDKKLGIRPQNQVQNIRQYNRDNLSVHFNRQLLKNLDRSSGTFKSYLDNLTKLLQVYGFKSLRPNQVDAIHHLFSGQDLLFVCSTGSGKSFIYVAAAVCMGLRTIVFSPLISLMQDQADKMIEKGLRVGVVSSSVTDREKSIAMARWSQGDLDILLVAPERLQNEDFLACMEKAPPEFIVVDEIHCAYEHGENFRASYKLIAPFVKRFTPKLFLGLTATMSTEVEEAVRHVFDLKDTKKLVRSYKRENLHFKSVSFSGADADSYIYREVNSAPYGPSIVYCSTVKLVDSLYQMYGRTIQGGAMTYHGQMSPSERESNQINFIKGHTRVVFATNAFGMGVDKSDITKVIFRTFPGTLEELIQGFGRGGRDGRDCDCILVGDLSTLNMQRMFIDMGYPSETYIRSFYRAMRLLAGTSGIVDHSLREICESGGVPSVYSNALTQILQGYNVVKRTEKKPEARIRCLKMPDEGDKLFSRLAQYMEKIEFIGSEEGGYIHFDLGFLAQEMGLGIETVKKWLKSFAELKLVEFKMPPAFPPLKIIGDINLVDFKYLHARRMEKESKLEEVVKFFHLPNDQKGDYLEEYFNKL